MDSYHFYASIFYLFLIPYVSLYFYYSYENYISVTFGVFLGCFLMGSIGGGAVGGLTFGEGLGRAGRVGWDAGSPLIGVLLIFCGAYQGAFFFCYRVFFEQAAGFHAALG